MILVLVSGAAFAQVEPVVDGSAKLSWGIDLGSGDNAESKHGFYNENDLTVMLPFFKRRGFSGGSSNKEADVYADISFLAYPGNYATVKDGKLSTNLFWSNAIDWSIEATLHFFKAYMTVYNKPDFSADKAKGWKPINSNRRLSPGAIYWFTPEFTGWGTKIGYAREDLMGLDFGLKLGSDGNWEGKRSDGEESASKPTYEEVKGDGTTVVKAGEVYYELVGKLASGDLVAGDLVPAGTTLAVGKTYIKATKEEFDAAHSQYAMGIDFSMTPVEKYLMLDATFNVIFNKDKYKTNYMGRMINFGFGITSKPIDGMTIKAGFDGAAVDKFAWDAGLSVAYKWVDAAIYLGGKHKHADNKDFNMAAHFAFTSKEEGDTNFVKGLAFGAVVNAYNLLSTPPADKTIPLGFKVDASYKAYINDAMWVKPYAAFYGETNNVEKFAVAYEAGVVYQPIEKVEVEAAWNHGIVGANTYEGGFLGKTMLKKPLNKKGHNGRFVLSLKLIF